MKPQGTLNRELMTLCGIEPIDVKSKTIKLEKIMENENFFYCTVQNMQEYGFSLTRILPYKDRMVDDSVLIRENTGH